VLAIGTGGAGILLSNERCLDQAAPGPGSDLTCIYCRIYFLAMVHRAKLFRNGGSQAVRLPKECRFPEGQDEVLVRREGRRVIVEPLDVWPPEFLALAGALKGDLPRPKQEPTSKLRDPFA